MYNLFLGQEVSSNRFKSCYGFALKANEKRYVMLEHLINVAGVLQQCEKLCKLDLNFFSTNQYGFFEKKSSLTAAVNLLDPIRKETYMDWHWLSKNVLM